MGIPLNLKIAFDKMLIFTKLFLPVCKQRRDGGAEAFLGALFQSAYHCGEDRKSEVSCFGTGEMAQWLKVFAGKPNNLSSILRARMVGEEDQFSPVLLGPPHARCIDGHPYPIH